jgi:hypothetical protein
MAVAVARTQEDCVKEAKMPRRVTAGRDEELELEKSTL